MNEQIAMQAARDRRPVFVYSCFRAASTWFWTRLRVHRELCCYYEVFNEQLAHLSLAGISAVRPDNWRSHHPSSGPYLTEFAPLLDTVSGVAGFPTESPLGSRFFGRAGIQGPLDGDVRLYLARLIDSARATQRVPVVTCTRLLGRAAGLRLAFGGTHILLVRNLFEQWNSAYGQLRSGNDYFIRMVFQQLSFGRRDRFFAYLMSMFDRNDQEDFACWMRDANADKVFCCYVASRIYLLLMTRRSCDLVVDVTGLGDRARRADTEAALLRLLGVRVDLGDFEQRVDYPKQLIQSPADCRMMLDELLTRCLLEAAATDGESRFARDLLDAAWDAHARFMAYTAGARELLEYDGRRIQELTNATGALQQRVTELSDEVAASAREVDTFKLAAEGRRLQAETVAADLRDSHRELIELRARLAVAQSCAR